MARQTPLRQKNAVEKLKDLITQVDKVTPSSRVFKIHDDSFAESMRLIGEAVPPGLDKPGPVIEWVGATLKGDDANASELAFKPEMRRFRI